MVITVIFVMTLMTFVVVNEQLQVYTNLFGKECLFMLIEVIGMMATYTSFLL